MRYLALLLLAGCGARAEFEAYNTELGEPLEVPVIPLETEAVTQVQDVPSGSVQSLEWFY